LIESSSRKRRACSNGSRSAVDVSLVSDSSSDGAGGGGVWDCFCQSGIEGDLLFVPSPAILTVTRGTGQYLSGQERKISLLCRWWLAREASVHAQIHRAEGQRIRSGKHDAGEGADAGKIYTLEVLVCKQRERYTLAI
jgi:hypothetical protein